MKMVFKFYGTYRWVMFEKLMMKIYDFFFIRLSRLGILYNIVQKSLRRWYLLVKKIKLLEMKNEKTTKTLG